MPSSAQFAKGDMVAIEEAEQVEHFREKIAV
jgi:hypothetical protein